MATNCANPKATANVQVICGSERASVDGFVSFNACWRSMTIKSTPPTSNAQAMGVALSGNSHPTALSERPPIAVITKETPIFTR